MFINIQGIYNITNLTNPDGISNPTVTRTSGDNLILQIYDGGWVDVPLGGSTYIDWDGNLYGTLGGFNLASEEVDDALEGNSMRLILDKGGAGCDIVLPTSDWGSQGNNYNNATDQGTWVFNLNPNFKVPLPAANFNGNLNLSGNENVDINGIFQLVVTSGTDGFGNNLPTTSAINDGQWKITDPNSDTDISAGFFEGTGLTASEQSGVYHSFTFVGPEILGNVDDNTSYWVQHRSIIESPVGSCNEGYRNWAPSTSNTEASTNWVHANITINNLQYIPTINVCTEESSYNYVCLESQPFSTTGLCSHDGTACTVGSNTCGGGNTCVAKYCTDTCNCPEGQCEDNICLGWGTSCNSNTTCDGTETIDDYVNQPSQNYCNYAPIAAFSVADDDDGDLTITIEDDSSDQLGEEIIAKRWDFNYNGGVPSFNTDYDWFAYYNPTYSEDSTTCSGQPICGTTGTSAFSGGGGIYTYSTAGTYSIYFEVWDASGIKHSSIIDEIVLNQRGCTDPRANNYSSLANQEDGTCEYIGCPYPAAGEGSASSTYFCDLETACNGGDCGQSYPCQDDGGDTIVDGVDPVTGTVTTHTYNVSNSVVDTNHDCEFAPLTDDNQTWLEGYITATESGNYWTDPGTTTAHVDLDAFLVTEYPNTTVGNTSIKNYFNNLEDRILLYGCNSTYIDPADPADSNAPSGYDLSASWSEVWCEDQYTLMNTGDCTTTYACNTTNNLNMTTPTCYDDAVHNLCANTSNCCTDSCCDGTSNDCVGDYSSWAASQHSTGYLTDCSTSCNCVGGDNDESVTCGSTTESHCTGALYWPMTYTNCSGGGSAVLVTDAEAGGTFESWCNYATYYTIDEANCTGSTDFVTWANNYTGTGGTEFPDGLWGSCDGGDGLGNSGAGLDCYGGWSDCAEWCTNNYFIAYEYGCTNINSCDYVATANKSCTLEGSQDSSSDMYGCTPCGEEVKVWWYPDQDLDGSAYGQGVKGCTADFPADTYINTCTTCTLVEDIVNGGTTTVCNDQANPFCVDDANPDCTTNNDDSCGVCNGGITICDYSTYDANNCPDGECDYLNDYKLTECGEQNDPSWVDECGICFGDNFNCELGGCLCSGCTTSAAINFDPEATINVIATCDNGTECDHTLEPDPCIAIDGSSCTTGTGYCQFLEGEGGVCTCDVCDLGGCCPADSNFETWCADHSTPLLPINEDNCGNDSSFPTWCNNDYYYTLSELNCKTSIYREGVCDGGGNTICYEDSNCTDVGDGTTCVKETFEKWCNDSTYYELNYTNCTTIPSPSIDFTPYCTANNWIPDSECTGLCNGGTDGGCIGFTDDYMLESACKGLCTHTPGYCHGSASCVAISDEGTCKDDVTCTWEDETTSCAGTPTMYMLEEDCGGTAAGGSGSQWCTYDATGGGSVSCQACPPNPGSSSGNCYENCVWDNFAGWEKTIILNADCAFPTHFTTAEQTTVLNDYCAFPTHFTDAEQTTALNDYCAFPTHFTSTEQSTALNTYCAFPTHFTNAEQLTALNTYCAFPTHFTNAEQTAALNDYCAFPTHFTNAEKTTALNTYCTLDHVIAAPASNGCVAGDQCHTLSTDCPTWNTANGYMLNSDCYAVVDSDGDGSNCIGYCDTYCLGYHPNDFQFLDTFYSGNDTTCVSNTPVQGTCDGGTACVLDIDCVNAGDGTICTGNTNFNSNETTCYSNLEDYLSGKGWSSLDSNIGGLFDEYCDDAGYHTINENNCNGTNGNLDGGSFPNWCNTAGYHSITQGNCSPGSDTWNPSAEDFENWCAATYYYPTTYLNCSGQGDASLVNGSSVGDEGTFESWCNLGDGTHTFHQLTSGNCGGAGYYTINEANCNGTNNGLDNNQFETWCNNIFYWPTTYTNCSGQGSALLVDGDTAGDNGTFESWCNLGDGSKSFYEINKTNCTTYDGDRFETWCTEELHWPTTYTNCSGQGSALLVDGTTAGDNGTFESWCNLGDGTNQFYRINSTNCADSSLGGTFYPLTYENCKNDDLNVDGTTAGDNGTFESWCNLEGYYTITSGNCTNTDYIPDDQTFESWCNDNTYWTINESNCSDHNLGGDYYTLNKSHCTPGTSAGYCSGAQSEIGTDNNPQPTTEEECLDPNNDGNMTGSAGTWTSLNPSDEDFVTWCGEHSPALVEINESNCTADDSFSTWCNGFGDGYYLLTEGNCSGETDFETWCNTDGYYGSTTDEGVQIYPTSVTDPQWLSGFTDTYYIGWCNTDLGRDYCQTWCETQDFTIGEAGYPDIPTTTTDNLPDWISYPLVDEFNMVDTDNSISGETFIKILEASFFDDSDDVLEIPNGSVIDILYKRPSNRVTINKNSAFSNIPAFNDKRVFGDWYILGGTAVDKLNFLGENIGMNLTEEGNVDSIRGFLVGFSTSSEVGKINWTLPTEEESS